MVASEVSQKLPILIIDKRGKIGQALVEKLQEQFLVVVVTGRDLEIHDNLVHIPYRKKIPEIPDNKYSHMFVVYNGEEEILAIMPSVMKKANATGAKVLFITSLLQGSPQLFQRFSEHLYHGMQIAMYGEVFDNAALDANQLNVFIHQIRLYGRVEIPESGLRRFYPIFFDDVVGGIIAIAFAQHVHHKPHLIFSKHGFTGLTIARILQKIDPMIKPDFKKQSAAPLTYHIPEDGEYAFQNYPLEDKLRRLDLSAKKAESPLEKRRLVLPKRRKNRHYAACITSLILALLIVPPLVVYTCSAAGLGLISLSVKQGESGQLAAARQTAGAGKSFFTFAQTLSGSMFALALVDGKANQSLQQHIQSGEQISQTAVDCFGALALLQNIVNGKDASDRKSVV